jgi:hypothetical protein
MRNRNFKKVYGPAPEQEVRKTRNNQEQGKLHKASDLAADIKRRNLEYLGRVIRVDQTRVAEKNFLK